MITDTNSLNMGPGDLDRHIYRIMPIHRLLGCLKQDELVLVPPKKWDDPFENYLLSSSFELPDGTKGNYVKVRERIFGQCWTFHRETDAMWRIYSQEKQGAKVRSTPRKLLSALAKRSGRFAASCCFIGKVEYLTIEDIKAKFDPVGLYDPNGIGSATSLLYKRKEFSHEKECRLLFTCGEGAVHRFHVDSKSLFDQVIFDPRMDLTLVEAYSAAIKNFGFKGIVQKSSLYQVPDPLVADFNV